MRFQSLAVTLLFLALGCSSKDVQTELRSDDDRPGKVGTLTALTLAQSALTTTTQMALQPNQQCGFPSKSRETTIRLVLKKGARQVSHWDERREFHHWDSSLQMVRTNVRFINGSNPREQTRFSEKRLISGSLFVRNREAGPFFVRGVGLPDSNRLMMQGMGSLQEALDAVGGWELESVGQWRQGNTPLRCSALPTPSEWLERFRSRGSLLNASFHADKDGRKLAASWALDQGYVMSLRVVEQPLERLEVIAPQELVDVRPDRSFLHARSLLKQMAETTEIEAPSER